jgi:hypothetical protein
VIPKPDHSPAVLFEPTRSVRVCGTVRMLTAIDFDH